MELDTFLLIFKSFSYAFLWMSFLWLIHLIIKNAAIVDVGWSICLFIYAFCYAYFTNGIQTYEFLLLFVVGLWSLRLSTFLFIDRIYKQKEEGRYAYLREQWKTLIPFKFFLFFHAQTFLNLILAIPFLLLSLSNQIQETFLYIGAITSLIAIAGETLADLQLKWFKAQKDSKGKTCRIGLWNYSRHPNYFFEFIYWVGLALMVQGSQNGFYAWLAPAIILITLFKVTGIPATERQALKSRGEAYRRYQKEVSRFFPMPPKKAD